MIVSPKLTAIVDIGGNSGTKHLCKTSDNNNVKLTGSKLDNNKCS